MKNILLPGLLSVALLIACSQETEQVFPSATPDETILKSASSQAENKTNPFDTVGAHYRGLLTEYQDGGYSPASFTEATAIVETIIGNKAVAIDADTESQLSEILSNPYESLTAVLEGSGLSPEAGEYLATFIDDFATLRQLPFATAYPEITTLENNVSSSVTLPEYDKRVILTITSLARYSLDHGCCEDTDWETSVGNIVAATAGAVSDGDKAIHYLLLTRITQHENIVF